MASTRFFLSAFGLFLSISLFAQTPLSIPTQNRCAFFTKEWEDELYSFDKSAQVQGYIDEILQNGGATANFTVLNASVESVVAIVDQTTGRRYLLYSQNFIEKAKDKLEVYAALAHEIGHHVYNHQLTTEGKEIEELEAYYFMGYALAKTNKIGDLNTVLTHIDSLEKATRRFIALERNNPKKEAITNGWQDALKSLSINSAGFDASAEKEEFLKAQFQILPCCSPFELPKNFFQNTPTLGKIAEKLKLTLNKQGYYYQSYKSFKDGFALITQMEQYNADYTFRNDHTRWVAMPMSGNFKGVMDYFQKMLFPQNRSFRTFVFVVTAHGIKEEERAVKVTKSEAESWYKTGVSKLPEAIAAQNTEGVSVTALVYEFQVPETNQKPKQTCPSIDTKRHLVQSKIWSSF